MTILVVNHGIMKSFSILTAVIHLMAEFEVAKRQDYFDQEVKWMQCIRLQLSTHSALDLDHVHRLRHALLQENDTYCLPEGY
jgi:hypothetical protein